MARLILGHIVNHRTPKGTKYVLDAIDHLRSEVHDFGFIFGECIPHKAALQMYTHIDVLLEQFILGWYGLQAVECMASGKIVVAWIKPWQASAAPPELLRELPIISADAGNLESVIRNVLAMSDDALLRIGEQGREFVKKWHDAETIARRLIRDYKTRQELPTPTTPWNDGG